MFDPNENPQSPSGNREKMIKKWSEDQEKKRKAQVGESSFLNRPWTLARNPTKREWGLFGILFMALALIVIFFMFGGNKKAEPMQQEEAFEAGAKRSIVLPKPPPPLPEPPPVTEKIDKEALALKEARLKSAIVIYNKSSTEKGGESNQSSVPTDPNRRFQEEARSSEVPTSQAKTLGNLDLKILQGKIVDAIMETAVNSDLPGMVRAVVSHDLYGESGRTILLPRGTRLVGQYNSSIRKGQARVFFIWNRAIRPDGIEIVLDSGGTDPLGRAGINGKVNNHFWQIFGTSALLSLIGSGAANAGVNTNDQLNSISAYREELANSFRDTSAQVLDRYIDIPPTINVKQGTRIKVLVARDLDFSETLGSQALSSANQGSWVFRL
jgi:type IV secretory pathway VirB10-like protein